MAITTGGGATHIATSSGVLRTLGSKTNVLIASGGGGGANGSIPGADAGGISGGYGHTGISSTNPGTQTTGYMFGQGSYGTGGGGSGIYGGNNYGAGGSGYIGNANLTNKKMVSYTNTPTSSDESTKTENTDKASENATKNTVKIGNGFVKITKLF